MKKTADSFLKGTLILTVAGIVVKVIGSLNWIFLSRVLSGEGIGLYQMAFPIYLLALSISSAGIPVAISIITAEKVALQDILGAKRVFRISLLMLVVTGLLLSVLMYFGASWLVEYRFIRDPRAYYSIVALAPAIFFVTILSSFRGYLQGWQVMTPTAVSQIVEQLVRVITMLIFANMLLPMGLEYAAAGASLGAAPGAFFGLLILIYYYFKLTAGDKGQEVPAVRQDSVATIIRRIAKLAFPVSVASIMLPVVSNIDLFIVPTRLEEAGYTVEQATELFGYLTGMAVPLINLATILTASLATSLVPAVSEAKAIGDHELIYQRTASAMKMNTFITIPGFVLILVLAAPIAQMIYHAPSAGAPIEVLSVGILLLGIHQVTTGVLQGMGYTTIPVVNMGISAVAKVALNWILTAMPALGIKGAAWATVGDIGIAAFLNMYFVYHYVGFSIDIKNTLRTLCAGAAMGVTVLYTYDTVMVYTFQNTMATITSIFTGGIVYLLVMLAIGGIEEEDVARMPMIGRGLTKALQGLKIFKPK